MIRYRPFLNSDPPAIADIWCNHPPLRALLQPMTPAALERHVLSKPFFDRRGLIVAVDDERPVGFVHAGFGASDDLGTLNPARGATCMLMVAPHEQLERIRRELLQASEEYLRSHGARTCYGGGSFPVDPFYLGLYGGSELPGVLASDSVMLDLYRSAGYVEAGGSIILQRSLTGFRPLVDRRQMQVRRGYHVHSQPDPPAASWWEACTAGLTDRTRFTLVPRDGEDMCCSAVFWDMEPLASSWGVHAMGLTRLETNADLRRQGLATFLASEALRALSAQGVTLVEVHCGQEDEPAMALMKKLGFQEVDRGVVLCKGAADK